MSKVKNITESVSYYVYQLASSPLPKDYIDALDRYIKVPSDDNRDVVVISEPEWFTKELNKLGFKAYDKCPVSVKLGSVIFDLYCQGSIPPKAPIANALYVKKRAEYADILSQDEFEVPDEVKDSAKVILTNDDKWDESAVSSTIVTANGEDVFMTMKASSIYSFRKILSELLNVFMGEK